MGRYSTQQPLRQLLVLCLGIIMLMSTVPLTSGDEEANEYTTIVLSPNKEFKIGDTGTIEIRFFNKNTLVDPDDINITIGDPDSGYGRHIEVEEEGSRIGKGIYRVTFTIEEGDDPWSMGAIYGSVRCTIGTGRSEKSDTNQFTLTLEQPRVLMLVVRVVADKPIFDEGDTVRFTVRYTYNGSLVDPDDPGASFQVNREYQNIVLSRESEGVYYYDYVSPEDGESKNLIIEASGSYNSSFGVGTGIANMDFFQVWFNADNITSTQLDGNIGISDMEGTSMELDVSVIYRYMNETWDEIIKQFDGSTNSSGLMEFTLEYDDIQANEFLDITVWANESSRGDNHQWSHTEIWLPSVQGPGEGFDVILENEQLFLTKDMEHTFNYTAYHNGTILNEKEILYFYYTTPMLAAMGMGHDGEMGEVYLNGSATTDENGMFSVTLTTPDKATVLMDLFKADFGTTRMGDGQYRQVQVTTMFVDINFNARTDLGIEWENFGSGQQASVTVSRDGQNGGRGGVHLHIFDPSPLGLDNPELEPAEIEEILNTPEAMNEINRWMYLNQHDFQYQSPFTGSEFSRDIGVPSFFPDTYQHLLFGGIFVDDGTRDGTVAIDFRIVEHEAAIEKELLVDFEFLGASRGESVNSEAEFYGIVTVTADSAVDGANIAIEVTGAGSADISSGVTDENGKLNISFTADNVTNNAREMKIYVNATKEGYRDGTANETITVNPYIPPGDMVITSSLPDTMVSEQIISMVITVKDGDTPLEGVYVTLRATGPAQTCKTSATTDENGQVFCSLILDNVTGEDSTVTVYFNGTLEGYNKGTYTKDVHVEAWKEPVEGKIMTITTDLPSIMYSGQIIPLTVTVTGDSVLQGVDITLVATGPGNTCKSEGVSDADGHVSCALTIHNVTGDDSVVIVYINGTKDGYQNVYYEKAVTITAWNPPIPEVVLEPVIIDLEGNSTATVIAGVQGNVTLNIQSATNPDESDTDALGLYLDITQSGNGTLSWAFIRIDYDQIPATIIPEALRMYYWDVVGEQWMRITNSGVNPVERYVWANVTHFTVFAPRQDPDDSTPPSITHNPIRKGDENSDITIKAAITDGGEGVQDAILYYRKDGDSQYTTLTMTKSGTSYEVTIPAENVKGKEILYYIEATDGTNTATHPANRDNPHVISIAADDDGGDWIPGFGILMIVGALVVSGTFYRKKRN